MNERHGHRGGLVWPVILIGAGVVFLLNNLGLVGWGVWATLWRLWPVLLIAAGLEILIGRRSLLGSLAVVVLLLAAFGWALWSGGTLGGVSSPDTVARTETISQPLAGARQADVEIAFGAGVLNVGAAQEGASLIEGTVELGRGESLSREARNSGDTLIFKLRSRNAWFFPSGPNWEGDRQWKLELNRDVPMQLDIKTGVGRSVLDFSQLNLTRLDVDSGVGQTDLTLPRRGRLAADVNCGVGDTTIFIPVGMAARVSVDTGVGQVNVSGAHERRGDIYTSPGYEGAENRIELSVDGGVGRISVRFGGE